jgi:hypothetical protein
MTVQDSTGHERIGQDRKGQDRTGQYSTGQDRTGQDRTGHIILTNDNFACHLSLRLSTSGHGGARNFHLQFTVI